MVHEKAEHGEKDRIGNNGEGGGCHVWPGDRWIGHRINIFNGYSLSFILSGTGFESMNLGRSDKKKQDWNKDLLLIKY